MAKVLCLGSQQKTLRKFSWCKVMKCVLDGFMVPKITELLDVNLPPKRPQWAAYAGSLQVFDESRWIE